MRAPIAAAALMAALPALASPASSASASIVHTDVREVAACLPRPGGVLAATAGGLVSVSEGGPARVWTAVDGLPGTRLHALVADGDRVWVGGESGAALVALSRDGMVVHRAVGSKPVRDVVHAGDRLVLATWGDGVRIADSRGRTAAVAMRGGDPALRVRVGAVASVSGALWAGTAAGLYRDDGAGLALVPLAAAGEPEPEVTSLLPDGAGVWIATASGLYHWDGARAVAMAGGDLRRVARVDGAIVVASLGGGLERVDRGRLVPLEAAPRELVMAQAVAGPAESGAACAGGLDGLWTRAAAWSRAALPAGPPSNDISALAHDGTRLWVGTFDRGVAVLEDGAWRAIAHPDLDARVNALAVDHRSGRPRVWVGTAAGLSMIDGDRVTRVRRDDGLPSRHVLSLAVLGDGRLLVGTTRGAALVGDGRPALLAAKQGLDVGNVWAVAEGADGALWLGTTTGLYRGRADDTGWVRRSVATGDLGDDWVTALAPRGEAMWIGMYKGGVARVAAGEPAGGVTRRREGWINPGGLAWVGPTLLAATMDGLDIADGERVAAPASPGRDTTAIAAAGGRLWIATRRGLIERSHP